MRAYELRMSSKPFALRVWDRAVADHNAATLYRVCRGYARAEDRAPAELAPAFAAACRLSAAACRRSGFASPLSVAEGR